MEGLPAGWRGVVQVTAVAGIINHCFLLAMASDMMPEYFFDKSIDDWQRAFCAFVAENALLLMYVVSE